MIEDPEDGISKVRKTFDKAAGIVEDDEVSYVKELMFSVPNTIGTVGTTFLCLILLANLGVEFAMLPLIAFGLFQTLLVLFVPEAAWFQRTVDKQRESERRDRTRDTLLRKVVNPRDLLAAEREQGDQTCMSIFVASQVNMRWVGWRFAIQEHNKTYLQMLQRIDTLRDLSKDESNNISDRMICQLEDQTNDYLRLVYQKLNLLDQLQSSSAEDIQGQIQVIESQIEEHAGHKVILTQLKKSRDALLRAQASMVQLPGREAAVSARLTAMGHTFEELYRRIVADPAARDISGFMDETIQRLSVEEELTLATQSELSGMDEFTRKRMTHVAAKANQMQG